MPLIVEVTSRLSKLVKLIEILNYAELPIGNFIFSWSLCEWTKLPKVDFSTNVWRRFCHSPQLLAHEMSQAVKLSKGH